MNRRHFLKTAACAALTTLGCSEWFKRKQPNILFIFADDQAFDTINALGYTDVQTPNLDRLVRNGVTFTHAYNMGAWHGAVCVASRTMLNTGRFLWEARDLEPELQSEQEEGRFWSQMMKNAGYETYMSGKWHVKDIDPQNIFDHVRDVRPGMPRDFFDWNNPAAHHLGYDRPVEGQADEWSPYDKSMGGYWNGGTHWSEVLGNHAVDFIDMAAASENPFFMYLAFNAPHDPRQSPKDYVEKYPLDTVPVPENFQPLYPYKDHIGCGPDLRDERLAPFPRTEYAVQVHRQEYYAIITHMDAQVGRILDALEASGKAKETFIFFTADHGLACGRHGLMGKQNMYDHSVRVPLFVNGPRIPKDITLNTPVYLQDIMPTVLDLAGASKPEHVDFNSLMPIITGKKEKQYDLIYGGYMELQRMVCDGEFKMIVYPAINKTILYNLEKDPLEMNDLAGDPQYEKKIEELRSKLTDLQQKLGDPLVTNKAL